jgi:nucleoside-diphosphate-sugar epimerase
MLAILEQHVPKITVTRVAKDALMPDRGTLSVEKARALIGYEPRWPLDVAYPRYIAWYRDLAERRPDLFAS